MKVTQFVVITRAATENASFAKGIAELGLEPLYCPAIRISNNLSKQELQEYFSQSYDWLIFTSSNGVKFFMEGLQEVGKDITILKSSRIAVVGEKTGETAKKYGLPISFIPSKFTAEDVAREIPDVQSKKVLLPRSTIGNPELITILEAREAMVVEMPVYKTEFLKIAMTEFIKRLNTKQISCLTFTSPSTVTSFMQNLEGVHEREEVLLLPTCSIGSTTTKVLKEYGFVKVYTAKIQTTDAMITQIRKNIL